MVETFAEPGYGNSPPRDIVVIGGGTGNSTLVRALTQPPFSGEGVTAVVTGFDDGGGTGELRKVYPELPAVGDLRQCLAAMSELPEAVLEAWGERWDGGNGSSEALRIEGQTPGNLLVASVIQSQLAKGRNLSTALEAIGKAFQIKGKVVPPSNDIRTLVFDLPNGKRIYGEHNAEESKDPSFQGARLSFLVGQREDYDTEEQAEAAISPAQISEEADQAIRSADLVILAPGDLYTSVGPNLAVNGMREAMQAAKAVLMISNLMNRSRHTVDFTTHDYAREYERIIGGRVIDAVIYNTATLDPGALREQRAAGSRKVQPDVSGMRRDGYNIRGFDLLSRELVQINPNDKLGPTRSTIRHDPARLAAAILNVTSMNGFHGKRRSR